MNKDLILYHIGRFNHVGSKQIVEWLNSSLGTGVSWQVYYAKETDVFDYTNGESLLFWRDGDQYLAAYVLISDIKLFLDITIGFTWCWKNGEHFNVDITGVPELGVRYYVGPKMTPKALKSPGVPPEDIDYLS